MEEETVEFKMDVSDESIKRKAMKVIWKFSGVTLVDIKDKRIVKVRGSKFKKADLGCELQMIDESVDIINPSRKAQQTYIPNVSSFFNYLYTPKEDIVIFEFEVLNELIILQAMEVIWEFSGITWVEIKGSDQIIVKGGEINKLDMVKKLQNKIGDNIKIKWFGDGSKAEKSSNTGISKGPIVRKTSFEEAIADSHQQHEATEKAKAERQHEAAEKAKGEILVMNKAMHVPKLPEKRSYKHRSKLLRCFCFR